MAVGVIVWSETAATNASADTSVNWAEGMAPSAVNDSARAEMASVAKWRDDLNATLLASGVSTALTLTTNQVQGALTAGYEVTFTTTFNIATPATINVDSLGAKPIHRLPNIDLLADQYKAGVPVRLSYFTSNSGEWIPQTVRAPAVKTQVITTTATTYTPTSGMAYCWVRCQGGGGAGGGTSTSTSGSHTSAGSGASGGTYSEIILSATQITSSQVATIGAAGAATSATSGGDGGASSLGSLCTAAGGIGGAKAVDNTNTGAAASPSTGTGDVSIAGQAGGASVADDTSSITIPGIGGDAVLGHGGVPAVTTSGGVAAGTAGTGFGSGGSGASKRFIGTAAAGGAGKAGVVIITEYF